MPNRIRDAIEVLLRRGWAQDSFTDDEGRHCLQGALYETYGLAPLTARRTPCPVSGELADDIRLLNRVIAEQYPDRTGGVGISRFNDHPETTVDDVLRVMEKAAVARDEAV
jgi:hypothetical protein